MTDYHLPPSLAEYAAAIDGWLHGFADGNPLVEAIDRSEPGDSPEPRWYVRLKGEEKEHITIWFTLGQRTLRYEAYVLPAPAENVAAVYETALRRNDRLVGVHFAIGVEVTAAAGSVVVAPAGRRHVAWNPTGKPVRLRIEMRPPLRWREFTTRFFAGDDPLALLAEYADEVALPPRD